jgi:hypothetical protein
LAKAVSILVCQNKNRDGVDMPSEYFGLSKPPIIRGNLHFETLFEALQNRFKTVSKPPYEKQKDEQLKTY